MGIFIPWQLANTINWDFVLQEIWFTSTPLDGSWWTDTLSGMLHRIPQRHQQNWALVAHVDNLLMNGHYIGLPPFPVLIYNPSLCFLGSPLLCPQILGSESALGGTQIKIVMKARVVIMEGCYTRQRMLNLTKVSAVLKEFKEGKDGKIKLAFLKVTPKACGTDENRGSKTEVGGRWWWFRNMNATELYMYNG